MRNSLKNILIALIICCPALIIIGCERDFSDEGNDFIAGKWRDASILSADSVKEEDLMGYVEYAPYNFVYDKRTFTSITYEYDSTQEKPYMRTTRIGHYTLKGDSLTVKDYKRQIRQYIVLFIRNDTLCYKDEENQTHFFIRYDGSGEIGKNIQDIYNK